MQLPDNEMSIGDKVKESMREEPVEGEEKNRIEGIVHVCKTMQNMIILQRQQNL